ncbi:hypothetical protein [Salinarimonas sp.]|uniref:hypothetical protein n=1 Tax=Salinarimonas sp. TaxID=2766526 RepID=UPI0032D954F6
MDDVVGRLIDDFGAPGRPVVEAGADLAQDVDDVLDAAPADAIDGPEPRDVGAARRSPYLEDVCSPDELGPGVRRIFALHDVCTAKIHGRRPRASSLRALPSELRAWALALTVEQARTVLDDAPDVILAHVDGERAHPRLLPMTRAAIRDRREEIRYAMPAAMIADPASSVSDAPRLH